MNISSIISTNLYAGALFGVEVEVEGASLPRAVKGFAVKHDGSLRGGKEYVFDSPKNLSEATRLLTLLEKELTTAPSKPEFSFRTSVHAHVNVTDLTIKEFQRVLYTLLLFEPAFLRFSGEGRRHNRFCLSSSDADGYLLDTVKLFGDKEAGAFAEQLLYFSDDNHKYSAINLACVKNFGTIELRTMRGTCDAVLLSTYLEVLDSIRSWAIRQKSVRSIYEKLTDGDAYGLCFEILGVNAAFLNYPRLEEEMFLQASLTIELPFAS